MQEEFFISTPAFNKAKERFQIKMCTESLGHTPLKTETSMKKLLDTAKAISQAVDTASKETSKFISQQVLISKFQKKLDHQRALKLVSNHLQQTTKKPNQKPPQTLVEVTSKVLEKSPCSECLELNRKLKENESKLSSTKTTLETAASKVKEQLYRYKEKYKHASTQNSKLLKRMREMLNDSKEQESQTQKTSSQIVEFQNQLTRYQEKLKLSEDRQLEKNTEIKHLEEIAASHNKQLIQEKEKVMRHSLELQRKSETITCLENKIQSLLEGIKVTEETIVDLKNTVRSQVVEQKRLQTVILEKVKENEVLRCESKYLKTSLNESNSKLSAVAEKETRFLSHNATLKVEVQSLRNQLTQKEEELEKFGRLKLESNNRSIESFVAEHKLENDKLRDENEKMSSKLSALTDEHKKELQDKESNLRIQKAILSDKSLELRQLKDKVLTLEKKLKESEDSSYLKLTRIQEANRELLVTNDEQEKAIATLENEFVRAEKVYTKYETLKENYAQQEENYSKTKVENENLEAKVRKLKKRQAMLATEYKKLSKQYKDQSEECSSQEQTIADLRIVEENLEKDNLNFRHAVDEAVRINSSLKAELQCEITKNESLQEDCMTKEKELTGLIKEKEVLHKQLQEEIKSSSVRINKVKQIIEGIE